MCVSASDCGRKPEKVEELIYSVAAKETRTQLTSHRANTSKRSQFNIFEKRWKARMEDFATSFLDQTTSTTDVCVNLSYS